MKLTQRESRVVWSDPVDSQFRSFATNGYYQEMSFFPKQDIENARIQAMIMREDYSGDGVIYERDEKTVRSIFGLYDIQHHIEDLLCTDKLISVAEHILDSKVYVHQLHINYKQAFVGGGFFWHSDYTYWHWEDGMPHPRALSFVIPLDRMRYENGPLYVQPRSHLYYGHSEFYRDRRYHPDDEVKHDDEDDGGATPDQLEMIDESMHVILGLPGDVCIMDANLLHMSTPNWSPYDRMCAFVCINSIDNIPRNPPSGAGHRPQYITNRVVKVL